MRGLRGALCYLCYLIFPTFQSEKKSVLRRDFALRKAPELSQCLHTQSCQDQLATRNDADGLLAVHVATNSGGHKVALRLVEEVQKGVDLKAAQQLADKVKSGAGFDLNDFLSQISQMKKMGGLSSLMDKLPSQLTAKAAGADMDRAERDVRRMEGIIRSMTPQERRKPSVLMDGKSKAGRKRRIAAGAGVQVQEVNRLLNEFGQMQDMMKKMKGGGLMKMMKRMGGMKGMPKLPGMG